jgi:hypothetical protein
MYNEEVIDFGKVDVATTSGYLMPGMWRLKVDPKNTSVVQPQGKTPYLNVKFVSESGDSVTEKFYLTAKALPRLQYLHEAWFNKRLDKTFSSMLAVGEYFQKALTAKIVTRNMVTGGKITADGKFYSGLPYTGFVIVNDDLFEEGLFEEGSARYKAAVTVEKPNPVVAGNNSPLLPDPTTMPSAGTDSTDDMPW